MSLNQHSRILDMYGPRASTYDNANGGWHVELGEEFAAWIDARPGESALDLGCGTGLVTIPLAEKVGPSGTVIGVDLTTEMVDEGRAKLQAKNEQKIGSVEWIVMDIASPALLDIPSIKKVIDEKGGFDIITVCSTFVLIPDQASALKFWTESLLRKGGRIILDVPTEDLTSQFLFTYHVPLAIGMPAFMSENRARITNIHSVEQLLQKAGLQVDRCFRTKSYIGPTWYDGDEKTALDLFYSFTSRKYPEFEKSGKLEEAKDAWLTWWKKALRSRDGGRLGFLDGHTLYVGLGRKP